MQSSSESRHGDDRRDQGDRLRVESAQHRQHHPSLRRAEPTCLLARDAKPFLCVRFWNITFSGMICNYKYIGYPRAL